MSTSGDFWRRGNEAITLAEAIDCWKRILKVDPGNRESRLKIAALKALDDPFSFN